MGQVTASHAALGCDSGHPSCSSVLCDYKPTAAELAFRDAWPERCERAAIAAMIARCRSGEAQRDLVSMRLVQVRAEAAAEELRRAERLARMAKHKPALADANRVSDAQFEQAREASIVDVIAARIELKRLGRDQYRAPCPFHEERTPSFYVRPPRGWHCHGCGEGGDAIKFVMLYDGVNFIEAVRRMAA